MIQEMVINKLFEDEEIAKIVGCSFGKVQRIKQNLHFYGMIKAFSNGVERPRSVILPILTALCKHSLKKKTWAILKQNEAVSVKQVRCKEC